MLSVVIPCFNEKGSVARFAAELFRDLDALGAPYEVLAIDDGSADGTGEALAALGRPELKVLTHCRNRGLGAALRTGFDAAQGDFIVTMDADLTFHPNQIRLLLEAQKATGADLVSGSPFLEKNGLQGVPWSRRLPSFLLNAYYRGLFGRQLTAYTPIFRLYRAPFLKSLALRSEGFEINAEVAARFLLAGRKVAEIAVVLTARTEGVSKLSRWRELKRHFISIARLLSTPTRG